jgi:uncharacterized membrane protein YphA (DoxX/SURF4 family)
MNKDTILYALGAILLGAVGIWFHDFALQWQPVPKELPGYTVLVYVSAALLVIGGAALLSGKAKIARGGALLLTSFFGLWTVALHLPNAIAGYRHIGAWLAPAECAFAALGGLALFSTGAGALRGTLLTTTRILAGVCCVVFGFAHFNYIDFTASMVPAWIPPNQTFWAWATGVAHVAAGVALVSGIQARLAAALEAAMMASFVVLLHIPLVLAAPAQHVNWAMLAVATTYAGAAWLVRKYAT